MRGRRWSFYTHLFRPIGLYPYRALETGVRSQNLSPLPWGEGGERSEPGEGLLGYVGPPDPSPPCK